MAEPTERVIGLAAFLQERMPHGCTLEDITSAVPGFRVDGELKGDKKQWETVRKRVQRDLDDLEKHFGIEVEFDSQRACYLLKPPFLTNDERFALIAASAAVDVDGIDEPELGELGAAVGERHHIVLSVPSRVSAICAGIRERQAIQFLYRERVRTVDAYAVGRWRTHWYVVGREHESDDIRKFRVDRIEGSQPSIGLITPIGPPRAYEIPADFDAVEELKLDPNDWGHDPPVIAIVRVQSDRIQNVQNEFGGRVVGRTPETCDLEINVRHYASFRDRLLAFRDNAVVIEPPELVAIVREHLVAVAKGEG